MIGIRMLAAAELVDGKFESWLVVDSAIGLFIGSSGFNLQESKQMENFGEQQCHRLRGKTYALT